MDIALAKKLLNDIAKDAMKKTLIDMGVYCTIHHKRIYKVVEHEFNLIVERHCNKLINALSVPDKAIQLSKNIYSDNRKKRKELAEELVRARDKLKKLHESHRKLEKKISDLQKTSLSFIDTAITQPPLPEYMASKDGNGMPEISGIYFIFSGSVIVYVGNSLNLKNRLRIGNHAALREGDFISFLPCNKDDLLFSESLYIGLLKPIRNFSSNRNAI